MTGEGTPVHVIYDGECPFCSGYVKLVRLREAAGAVTLLDARQPHPMVDRVLAAGFDLDEGMAMVIGDQILHGDDVIHRIALLSGPSGLFNRLNWWVFRSPARSRRLYPLLRAGRNLALALLGHKQLKDKGLVPARERQAG